MSTRSDQRPPKPEGLSPGTLAIASASSIAAAIFIHQIWKGGAIIGAGITPIIVALTSEMLKRPTQRITAIRSERRDRSQVDRRTGPEAPIAPPPELERPDPFGIWEADRPRRSAWDRIKGRPLKIALATGVVAFLVAGFATTGAQLLFGGGGDGRPNLIYVPGKQNRADTDRDEDTTTTTETQPAQTTTQPPPATQTTPPPTAPPATTPTVPQTTPAPAPAPLNEQPQGPATTAPGGTPAPDESTTPPGG